jgi:hypothetical protein
MAKYIVDRRTWYRGMTDDGNSLLLRSDGKRCCIGFVGQQCGIVDEELLNKGTVYKAPSALWPDWMKESKINFGTDIALAYETNDTVRLTDESREAILKKIFARNGDEIEFEN